MDRYYARICWNSERWQIPTGEVRSLKLEQSPSYVLTQGFGHEEWLFDFTDTLDGYQYAFLQPVHKSTALLGKAVDVILYAITPDKKRVMIAEIINLEVLTADQQAYAFAASTKIGRVARMRSELEKLGIDPRPLGISDLFNVRFKRENVCFSGEPYREISSEGALHESEAILYVSRSSWADQI